jgi:3-hydroxyisobutyrate dehydrogenase-like beta-hydroxyacid dehydrogenase
VPLPATALVDQMFAALMAKGRGGWDHAALITLLEHRPASRNYT